MTRGWRLVAVTASVLTVICLALGLDAILSRSRLSDVVDARRLDISSIDITTGRGDAFLSASGMMPGDVVAAAFTVVNSGDRSMSYAMSQSRISDDGADLSAALMLTIRTVGSSCAHRDGMMLFDGPLDQAAFGIDGTGRPLSAASAEILCFRTTLPLEAGNGLQGAATTVTLSFGAVQQAAAR
jgi:hypothetical protein